MSAVAEIVLARRSTRAFLDREVPEDVLRRLFDRAQRAPSWCNIQPWRVWVASGDLRRELTTALVAASRSDGPTPDVPFPYDYPEPYSTHRRACGRALYQAMGVERDDKDGRHAAWIRNFVAFDAPHIAMVGIDRRFDIYGALDVGCWLQTLMLLATDEGIASCAQASLSLYPAIPRRLLGISDDVKILFGIGLGYEDPEAKANACRTTREPLAANVVFAQ